MANQIYHGLDRVKKHSLYIMAFLLAVCVALNMSLSVFAKTPAKFGEAKETDIAAFIDLFPIASYNVNDTTYILAENLVNYGFDIEASTEDMLKITFNENKDFVPLRVEEINRTKENVLKAGITHAVYVTSKQVYLDGTEVKALEMDGRLMIPFKALSKYGAISWDSGKRQSSLIYKRTPVTKEDSDNSPLSGRVVFSKEVQKFVHGNGGEYPYTTTDYFNNSYQDGKLNGYCISMISNIMYGDIRREGVYKNGVIDGPYRESSLDEKYLYGYHVEWDGRYANGEKVLYELDSERNRLPFTDVLSGRNITVFIKSDGSCYSMSNFGLEYGSPTYLGESLEESGWFDGAEKSEYLISDKGQFIRRDNKQLIAEQVKNVYQSDVSPGWDANRTLILKEDNSLWICRLNHTDDSSSWNDGKDLSKPVKMMDNVISAAATGTSAYFAIKEDSSLWWFGENFHGEAGNGTIDAFNYEEHIEDFTAYKPVKVMDNVAEAACGNGHVLALTKDGVMYGWGRNDSGQLGQGDTKEYLKPVKMLDNVTAIGASWSSSYAIRKDGTLWCCGGVTSQPQLDFVQIKDVYRYLSENFFD